MKSINQCLINMGNMAMVALTAVMRKLLVYTNNQLKSLVTQPAEPSGTSNSN